jgi:hypothetical protein
MANEEESMLNAAKEEVQGAAPVISGGISARDPEIQAKLAEMGRIKTGDVFRTGLMGAAAGAQAGQGMTNPLAAFVQGAAMGLQVPAQIYAQKQKQIESVVGATPFGVMVPEAQNPDSPYNILAGLPYDLAVKAIAGIAQDTAKIRAEGEQGKLRQAEKFKYDVGLKAFEQSLKGKDPARYEDISSMAKDFRNLEQVQQYQSAKVANEMIKQAPDDAAGDIMIMSNYAKILNPQTRFSEGNLDATDISSSLDKYTKGLYDKVINGKKLQIDERNKIKAAAYKAYAIRRNEYQNIADIWEQKATEYGMDPNFIVSDKGWESATIQGKPVMIRRLDNGKVEVRP